MTESTSTTDSPAETRNGPDSAKPSPPSGPATPSSSPNSTGSASSTSWTWSPNSNQTSSAPAPAPATACRSPLSGKGRHVSSPAGKHHSSSQIPDRLERHREGGVPGHQRRQGLDLLVTCLIKP